MMDKVKDIDWSPCPQDACPVVKTLNSRAGQPECGSWFCHLLAEQRWPRCFPLYASVTTSVEWPQQPSLNHRTIRRIKWANSCKPLWRVAGTWQTLYKCLLHKFKKNGWSIRGQIWCLPAVGHMTTFTMGKGENFPSVFQFPLVLSFFKLCLWAAESTSAYSSLKYAAMDSLREKNFQTPSVKYAKGLR